MPLLGDFPSPALVREAFAGGFSEKGTALLTLDELEMYSSGQGNRTERLYKCPFCGASERAFHVNVETGSFNCKRSSCGVKGRLREFWPERPPSTLNSFGGSTPRARIKNAAFDLTPEKPFEPTAGGNWRELWGRSVALDEPDANTGRDFLRGRGVSVEVARAANVRFCRNWAPSPERKPYDGGAAILFPLLDRRGDLVAVNGRYLQPKPGTSKARTGGDAAQGVFRAITGALEDEQPVLVEGPIDALALATCGVPALAMSGTNCPAWLPLALAMKAPFLAPDGDESGSKALSRWQHAFTPLAPRLRVLRLDDFKDFGQCIQRDGAAALETWLVQAGVLPRMCDEPEHTQTRLGAEINSPSPRNLLEAAKVRLALGPNPTWKQLRPLFAIAHAALDFAPDFKPENLIEWSRCVLCAQEPEEKASYES